MSEQNTPEEFVPSIEDNAHQTANELLLDAMDAVPILVPERQIHAAEAMLIHAHAMIAKLDAMETSQLAAHRELMEALSKIASKLCEVMPHGRR